MKKLLFVGVGILAFIGTLNSLPVVADSESAPNVSVSLPVLAPITNTPTTNDMPPIATASVETSNPLTGTEYIPDTTVNGLTSLAEYVNWLNANGSPNAHICPDNYYEICYTSS